MTASSILESTRPDAVAGIGAAAAGGRSGSRGLSRRALLTCLALTAGGCSPHSDSASGTTAPAPPPAMTFGASTATPSVNIPFTLSTGAGGRLVVVPAAAPPAEVKTLWTLGGDFARIASLPLDERSLFGSSSTTPDNVYSYAPSLLGQDGRDEPLTPRPAGDGVGYYEPQDGTATERWIIWRSSAVNPANQAVTDVDDWAVQIYDRAGGAVTDLGTARALNGVDTTPRTRGETLPTCSATNVYFCSSVSVEGGSSWKTSILRFPLPGGASTAPTAPASGCGGIAVADGDFPAALNDGVLFATASAPGGALDTVCRLTEGGGGPSTLFSISSPGGTWAVSGLWAASDRRVVAVTSPSDGGAFLGVWKEPEQAPSLWLSTISPSVVASLNDTWLVWGSGSQGDGSEMYAMNWEEEVPRLLGLAPGYSRPVLAPGGSTVLIPGNDGTRPTSWTVGSLG